MRKNILVTGGLGHIGSQIIRKLDHDITVVDNLLTQRYCSLFELDKKINFVESDFSELDSSFLSTFDEILHFGAITDAAGSFDNKEELEKHNVVSTKKLINKFVDSTCKRFIFPSSTSVYGVAASVVDEDNDEYVNPQSPYAESKVEIENYLKLKIDPTTHNYIIPRFGTIYGFSVGMRFHTAINKFIWQSKMKEPLTIWKENYKQYRPYLELSDCVRSVQHLLEIPYMDAKNNTIYNILTNNYTLEEVIENLEKVFGKQELNFVETPLLNQFSYKVNDSKIRRTGFVPSGDLQLSLVSTSVAMDGIR
mgnify:FL=1